MMFFNDAFKLAITKFKIRKLRAFFTALMAALLLSFILLGSFMYTGVRNSISDAVPAGFEDRFITYQGLVPGFASFEENQEFIEPEYNQTLEQVQKQAGPFNPKVIHEQRRAYGGSVNYGTDYDAETIRGFGTNGREGIDDGPPEEYPTGYVDTTARSKELLKPYLNQGYSFDDYEILPIIVRSDQVLEIAGIKINEPDTTEQRLAKTREASGKVIGSTLPLTFATGLNEDDKELIYTTVQAQIVGVLPDANDLLALAGVETSSDNSGLYLPLEAVVGTELEQHFGKDAEINFFVEFNNKEDMLAYIDTSCKGNDCYFSEENQVVINAYANYQIPFDESARQAWGFFKYVFGFFIGLAAISVFATTSKVIIDSRRETGVFRAIGAQRIHIAQIYALYTMLLMLVAYTIAFVLSSGFAAYLTSRFSDTFTAQIALVTGATNPAGTFSFYGITWWHHVVILLGAVALGWAGAVVPVMRSLRKDPLKFLRDD